MQKIGDTFVHVKMDDAYQTNIESDIDVNNQKKLESLKLAIQRKVHAHLKRKL